MAIAPLAAAVSLVPMACGGDEAAMRGTLTDDGCTYDGDTSPTAGRFTIAVENQTEFFGSFVRSSPKTTRSSSTTTRARVSLRWRWEIRPRR